MNLILTIIMILSCRDNTFSNETSLNLNNSKSDYSSKVLCNDTLSISSIYLKAHSLFNYMAENNSDSFSVLKAKEIVKVYNSFSYIEVAKKDSVFVEKYSYRFLHQYFPSAKNRLKVTSGVGASIYSSTLDMYIGFSMDIDRKDFYIFWKADSVGNIKIIE